MTRRSRRIGLALVALAATSLTVLGAAPAGADDGAADGTSDVLSDPSARLDQHGDLYFVEPTDAGPPELVQGAPPFPLDQTFLLHSRPTSTHVIYLDFDGTTVSGTAWNASGLPNGFYSGYSLDGDLATFNDSEREQIQSIWQRVSEDYAAFDVDVTTQDPGLAAIDRTNSADQNFGTRAVISDNTTVSTSVCPTGCGGVAYVGVFDDFGSGTGAHEYHQPAWIFGHMLASNDTKDIAEATSHEVGHNFGLSHDGNTVAAPGCSSAGYYCGHAMWAPIMGVGYQKPVVQWSRGEYTNANQGQDDLAIIAAGGAPVIADEAGSTVGTAAGTLPTRAVITSASDTDTYALGTCAGPVTVTGTGAAPSPDLDLELELLSSAGAVLLTADPVSTFVNRDSATGLGATLSTTLPAGSYYVRVDGVGTGTGATGYTDYGSIGAYGLTSTGCGVTLAPGAPTGLVVGTAADGRSATVTWAAPAFDGGSPVTGYTVGRTGGPSQDVGAGTLTTTWSGLTPGTAYTFTVTAKNVVGPGEVASATATQPNVPGAAPTPKAKKGKKGGKKTASVTWTPAANGGSPVTGWTVLVYKASGALKKTVSGLPASASSYTFKGKGGKYRFAVVATNAVGAGATSPQSRAVKAQ